MLKELTQWPTNIYISINIPCLGNIPRAFYVDSVIKCSQHFFQKNTSCLYKSQFDRCFECQVSSKVFYVSAASTGGWFASKSVWAKGVSKLHTID